MLSRGATADIVRSLRALVVLAAAAACQTAPAQRVQIPTAAPPSTFAQPGSPVTLGAPAPAFDPYGATTPSMLGVPAGPPPPALPYNYTAPSLGAPAYGGAPAYAAPPGYGAAPLGASPYDAPFVGAPGIAPSYDPNAPPSGPGIGPEYGGTLGWQPGTYGFQSSDGAVTRFRQFLARLRGEHTFLYSDFADDDDFLEVNRTEIAATFAFPYFGQIDTPFLVTPGFAFNWFDGPNAGPAPAPNLPPRVYDAYVDFAWFPRFGDGGGAELGVRTGVWTDFEDVSSDAVRVLGRALGVITVSQNVDVLLGVVYLDRLEIKLLPAGGVRWRPTPDVEWYLVFPNPKVRRMLQTGGGVTWWGFVAGEYGGGNWTADRVGQPGDRFDYNDIRVTAGLEWETPSQARGHMEVGFVFERELVFDSGAPAIEELDEAILFRVGIGY